MLAKKWKFISNLAINRPDSSPDCLPHGSHQNQVVTRESVAAFTVHTNDLEAVMPPLGSCSFCLEENNKKVFTTCKCENGTDQEDLLKTLANYNDKSHVNANSSFAHAVVNMIGMLIGMSSVHAVF